MAAQTYNTFANEEAGNAPSKPSGITRKSVAAGAALLATNLTLPRKAPNLGPFKSIKVVDPSTIYLKDGSGATLVELDVELKVD